MLCFVLCVCVLFRWAYITIHSHVNKHHTRLRPPWKVSICQRLSTLWSMSYSVRDSRLTMDPPMSENNDIHCQDTCASHSSRCNRVSCWHHQMETFSALRAICEFPAHRPVTQSFDVFFDLRPNKRLSKQSWGWWFETPFRPPQRYHNDEINQNM